MARLDDEVDGVERRERHRRVREVDAVEAALPVDLGRVAREVDERAREPFAMGRSVRPASSTALRALMVVFSSDWLPLTVVKPTTSRCLAARKIVSMSS